MMSKENNKHEREHYDHEHYHTRFDIFDTGIGEDWVGDIDIKSDGFGYITIERKDTRSKMTKLHERLDQLGEDAEDIIAEALDILLSKHADYGPLNILNAPGGPYAGLAVRLHDKVARLANLTSTGQEPKHESVRDTFMDILNYGLIGILVLEDKWGE